MNYQQARIFCISAIIILVLLGIGCIMRCTRSNAGADSEASEPITTQTAKVPEKRHVTLKISDKVGNLGTQFNDLNDAHMSHASRIGISPIETTADIMRISRPIVELKSGKYYALDSLTHSYAYLVPEAADLLDEIGERFHNKIAQQGGGDYKLKVTSLLRTRESVNRLKRGNVNSTENSTHLYGTTFDISYAKFIEQPGNKIRHTDGELKNLLAEVLLELRESGKCLVKFERKQGCFHITATGQ